MVKISQICNNYNKFAHSTIYSDIYRHNKTFIIWNRFLTLSTKSVRARCVA